MIVPATECAEIWDQEFSNANVPADTLAPTASNVFCALGTAQAMAFAKMGSAFVLEGTLELTVPLLFA